MISGRMEVDLFKFAKYWMPNLATILKNVSQVSLNWLKLNVSLNIWKNYLFWVYAILISWSHAQNLHRLGFWTHKNGLIYKVFERAKPLGLSCVGWNEEFTVPEQNLEKSGKVWKIKVRRSMVGKSYSEWIRLLIGSFS